MRRLVAIVTAISFAMAAPAFAQTAPAIGSTQQSSQTPQDTQQSLLLDGQDAMAQFCNPNTDPNCAPGNNGLLVALGVAGAIGGIIFAISQANKHAVSP